HLCFLSWCCGHESHEQDGERLRGAEIPRPVAASGDPAMTFMPIVRRTLIARRCGGLCRRHCSGCDRASAECAPVSRAEWSAAVPDLLEQALVAPLIDAFEIVEKWATLGHDFK